MQGPELGKSFKLVFLTVVLLTVVSLAVSLCLVTRFETPNEQVKGLMETMSTTWKMGFGAIIGLIGGKVT
jgi:hypothetical protein